MIDGTLLGEHVVVVVVVVVVVLECCFVRCLLLCGFWPDSASSFWEKHHRFAG